MKRWVSDTLELEIKRWEAKRRNWLLLTLVVGNLAFWAGLFFGRGIK